MTDKSEKMTGAERFDKVNRKMTVVWTGVAVVVVLALAAILFFASKGGQKPSPAGSGSLEGTVIINDKGQQVLVDEAGNEIAVLDEDPIETIRQTGNSNLSGVHTDTGSGTSGTGEQTEKTPWNTLEDQDYGITVKTMAAGYDGAFLEDGSDEEVKNVLALQFVNTSDKDIQYAEYVFTVDGKPISFKLSDLPAGQSCVALEASRHQRNANEVLELISRVVAPVDMLHEDAANQVLIVRNDDNSLTVMNTTDRELPLVRIYYKYFYPEENTFVGGITYTATAEHIPAGGSVTITPSHFEDAACVITGYGVYDQ